MVPPLPVTQSRTETAAPLRMLTAVEVDAAHPGLRGERDELGAGQVGGDDRDPCLGEVDDGPALWRLVGERRQQRRLGELGFRDTAGRDELRRHPVPVGDRAGLVQQQRRAVPAASTARPDMARTLRCTIRSMPAMPIADSRPPIVVGARQTNSATSTAVDWMALS